MNYISRYLKLGYLKKDFSSGLSVFLIALPLCLGIALASGAPLYAGLFSGVIGGIVVGFISGSQLSVSGPAAGLTTLVGSAILAAGDYQIFLLVVMIAGLFQLVLGLLKLGVIANYFPNSVIKGMLAAIGLILIEKQIPLIIGWNKPEFMSDNISDTFSYGHFFSNLHNFELYTSYGVIFLSIFSVALLIILNQKFAKKINLIPPTLTIVLIGIFFSIITEKYFPSLYIDKTHLVSVPEDIVSEMVFPKFTALFSSFDIWKSGIIIGLVASLETLLCVEAVDNLDKENRITPVNRELIAQGIGNLICGLIGAIPLTSVIVRGSANLDSGAKTKIAAIIHGILLLLSIIFIPFLLNKIPYPSLSAILIIVGYNLTKPSLYISIWRQGLKQFFPFILTIIIILITDLLVGVIIGLLLSIFFIIKENFKEQYEITTFIENETKHFNIKLFRNVTFLNKVKLVNTLNNIPEYSIVKIDGTDCTFIDHDIKDLFSKFRNKAHNKHIELDLINIEIVEVLNH